MLGPPVREREREMKRARKRRSRDRGPHKREEPGLEYALVIWELWVRSLIHHMILQGITPEPHQERLLSTGVAVSTTG